ncbi:hypothetical protein GXW83_12945 [Streptacidiphilus sp. PB12-B1b]|uniref:hypothetical protein n=1 Tax=Streptacidiphilus sp. PB12-B1b TaxID=2705012 RepID=UPI0015FAC40F|nr:hypothetical protein [Streptacidiphilus sp. PB12-B1b]QMU76515.1 hypothetical protein GXW83_12945 [Streptacidiphilus sp. PB12-B1b]
MATLQHRPQTAAPDLEAALAAVEAAYRRLMAAERPEPGLLQDFQRRTRELNAAADRTRGEPPPGPSQRVRCRCAGAVRGAQWIIRHST